MKKYVIISGVPRAGKSTVSQIIAKKFGFQHISMDSIIAGIEKVFPETQINSEAPVEPWKNLEYISSRITPFIRTIIDSGEYDECNYGVVIDVFQLLPCDYIKFIDNSKCDIYYLLSSDVTPTERFELLKLFDTPKDYTYYRSEEENRNDCIDIVNISKLIKEQCILYGLPYYETTKNRDAIIKEFITSLL